MVSAAEGYAATAVEGLEVNTRRDGVFHAVTHLFVLARLVLLWDRRHRGGTDARSRDSVLQIRHVRPGPHQLAYDLGFLAFGASLVFVGGHLARNSRPRCTELGLPLVCSG